MGPAGSKIVDPTFGTTTMRLTDGNDLGGTCGGAEVGYAYYPTFNCNATWVFVNAVGNAGYGVPYFIPFNPNAFTRGTGFTPTTNPPSGSIPHVWDMIWSGTNPDLIYFHNQAKHLYSFNVTSKTFTLVKDFSSILGANEYFDQQYMTPDDSKFAFLLSSQPFSSVPAGVMFWDRTKDQVVRKAAEPAIFEAGWDKTGTYFFENFNPGYPNLATPANTSSRFYNAATMTVTTVGPGLANGGMFHHDVGRNAMFMPGDYENEWRIRSFSNPMQWTSILRGYLGATEREHYCLLADNEQWAIISHTIINGGTVARFGDNEIFQVATDGSNRVRRIAHPRLVNDGSYYSPMANVSRDGQYIAFKSNWGSKTGRRDVYVVRIPPAPDSTKVSIRVLGADARALLSPAKPFLIMDIFGRRVKPLAVAEKVMKISRWNALGPQSEIVVIHK